MCYFYMMCKRLHCFLERLTYTAEFSEAERRLEARHSGPRGHGEDRDDYCEKLGKHFRTEE